MFTITPENLVFARGLGLSESDIGTLHERVNKVVSKLPETNYAGNQVLVYELSHLAIAQETGTKPGGLVADFA